MDEETDVKETYLFLDFNGKIDRELIEKPNLFFRLADLETPEPVLQINDLLFRGTYEDCLGTNLFFEEVEDDRVQKSPFDQDTPITLNYLIKQTKILKLRSVKIKKDVEQTDIDESFNLNLNQDYKEVLQKLESGSLCLEDLIAPESCPNTCGVITGKEFIPPPVPPLPLPLPPPSLPLSPPPAPVCEEVKVESTVIESQSDVVNIEPSTSETIIVDNEIVTNEEEEALLSTRAFKDIKQDDNVTLKIKYEKLKELARRPVHRETLEETPVQNCEEKYRNAYEFHNIERQILQRSDSFPFITNYNNENTLENFVDLERCALLGIIESSDEHPRILKPEEIEKLFKFEYFPYLSIEGRCFVLKRELEALKGLLDESNMSRVDQFSRTPNDICEILEKLVNKVETYLSSFKEGFDSENMDVEEELEVLPEDHGD